MKTPALIMLPVLLAGCASSAPERFIRQNPVQKTILPKTVSLRNSRLEAAFAPDSMGRMVSLKYRGEEILERFERTALVGNPLFEPVNCNVCGFRDLLWGVRMTTLDLPADLAARTETRIEFSAPNYGNTPLHLYRRVKLHPDSLTVDFDLTVTNSASRPYSYNLWLNLLPRKPYAPLVPIPSGLLKIITRGNNFHPAGTCWTAAKLTRPDAVIAMTWKPEEIQPDGRFYVHGAQDFNTFEAILGKRTLSSGAKAHHAYRFLIFPSLPTLNAILEQTGIAAVNDNGKWALIFCTAETVPRRTVKLKFPRSTAEIDLPEMKTGECFTMPVSGKPVSIISGNGIEHRLFF